VDLAGGHLIVTLFLSAVILLIVGLALPITASYVIAAVMVALPDRTGCPRDSRPYVYFLLCRAF
jgi:hypothetical protein